MRIETGTSVVVDVEVSRDAALWARVQAEQGEEQSE